MHAAGENPLRGGPRLSTCPALLLSRASACHVRRWQALDNAANAAEIEPHLAQGRVDSRVGVRFAALGGRVSEAGVPVVVRGRARRLRVEHTYGSTGPDAPKDHLVRKGMEQQY